MLIAQSIDNDSTALKNVGTYLFRDNNIPKALELNNQLFLKFTRNNDTIHLSHVHNKYGWIYDYMMIYEKALEHYKIALELARKSKLYDNEVLILNNMGVSYRDKARREADSGQDKLKYYFQAIEYYQQAYKKSKEYKFEENNSAYYLPIYNLGITYNFIAEEYLILDEKDKVATYYEKSHPFIKALLTNEGIVRHGVMEQSIIYRSLGNYHAYKNNNIQALEFYNKGVEVAQNMPHPERTLFLIYKDLISFHQKNIVDYEKVVQYSDSLKVHSTRLVEITNRSAEKANKQILEFEQAKFDIEKLTLEQEAKRKETERAKTLNLLVLFICLALLVFAVAFYKKSKESNSLRLKAENALQQKINIEQKINRIEDSIAADLHDNFGNKLNSIITAYETLKKVDLKNDGKDQNAKQLSSLLETNLRSLSADIKDLLWANNSKNNRLDNIITRIKSYLSELERSNPKLKTKLITNYNSTKKDIVLPKLANRQILMIVKEATHNAVKYAKTDSIEVIITVSDDDFLEINCVDYGIGFNRDALKRINGLNNMEERSKTIGFQFKIDSALNKGTRISLRSNATLAV